MDVRRQSSAIPRQARLASEPDLRRPLVLVLEPDRPIRALVAEWLEMAGYEFVDAREFGGAAGIATRCEVVLIDVRAPLQSARETIAGIAAALPHASIVAMSADALASGRTATEAVARELAVAAVLVKPFDREALTQALRRTGCRPKRG